MPQFPHLHKVPTDIGSCNWLEEPAALGGDFGQHGQQQAEPPSRSLPRLYAKVRVCVNTPSARGTR